jgi:GTP-binding protein
VETVQTRIKRENLPVVVIAGRPNAGKSTLFNRLVGYRRAITDPTPGVTRDPIEAECEIGESGKFITLVDTGGFKMDKEGLDAEVVRRSLETIKTADLIILLMDITAITPEDEHFVSKLRPYSDRVILAVNKADSENRDADAYNYLAFGFKDMVFISAEHGRNMGELKALLLKRLDFSRVKEFEDKHTDIRLAIIGKPNTGKSTLMNRLLGEEKSLVSDVAGTTRDVVEASFTSQKRVFTVLDTAGMRRKAKVNDKVEYYSVNRAVKSMEDCDVTILMIDAESGLTDQDKKIAGLAVDKGRGLIFALNKWDQQDKSRKAFEAARDKLQYFFGQMAFAPVLPISAKEGTGIDELLAAVVRVYNQLNRRIETGPLNKAVEDWVAYYPPPVGPDTHFKLRYATQISANPVKFVFFVSRPEAVKNAYVTYLKNRIRKDLGFDNVPVSLELRGSKTENPFANKPRKKY